MNSFDWGAVISVALALAAYVISIEVRLWLVRSELIRTKQQAMDQAIRDHVQSLSDVELERDLEDELGPGKPRA